MVNSIFVVYLTMLCQLHRLYSKPWEN